MGVSSDKDPQARRLIEGGDTLVFTFEELEEDHGKFDLVKLDVEGEEIKILKSNKHPMAKQLSVEFHAHLGQTKEELDALLEYLSQFYTIHAKWESRHGAGFNYWDTLLISKT